MSWTTNQVTQNGNTTRSWTISGGSLSTHDAIVIKPTSGNSRLEIEAITIGIDPTNYSVRVRVHGADAMAFRFAAEQMD